MLLCNLTRFNWDKFRVFGLEGGKYRDDCKGSSIVMIARVLNGTQCLIPAAMLRIGYAKTYLHFVVELKKLCALVAAGERS